jgi:hypothetical protein
MGVGMAAALPEKLPGMPGNVATIGSPSRIVMAGWLRASATGATPTKNVPHATAAAASDANSFRIRPSAAPGTGG